MKGLRYIIVCLICSMMLLFFPIMATADTVPTVTLSFDKSAVEVGERITATYQIEGNGTYTEIMWQWAIQTEDGNWQGVSSDEFNVSEKMMGSFSIVPQFGVNLRCSVYVKEINGYWHDNVNIWSVPVKGNQTYAPPIVKLKLDKPTISLGESVKASYEVNGEGDYAEVMWQWAVQVEDGSWQGISDNAPNGTNYSDKLNGEFSITPGFGYRIKCSIHVKESNGRWHFGLNEIEIPIIGYIPLEPKILIELDKDTVRIGEELSAKYEVTGDDKYDHVFWQWSVQVSENNGQAITPSENVSGKMNGKISLIPRFGERIKCRLYVVAANGRVYTNVSDEIRILGFSDGYDTYTVTQGGSQITSGKTSLTFCANGAFERFLGVQVDGEYLPQSAYAAWSGSTYVELSANYLNTLEDGTHELILVFDDGVAVTSFSVDHGMDEIKNLPKTGDESRLLLWTTTLGACALAAVWLLGKRCLAK